MTTTLTRHAALATMTAALLLTTACSKTPDVAAASSPATAVPPSGATAAAETADLDVTSGVKTALLLDEQVRGFDIAVETIKGDVRLTGMVDTQAQIDQAIKVARAVRGTHSIHDELALKKP